MHTLEATAARKGKTPATVQERFGSEQFSEVPAGQHHRAHQQRDAKATDGLVANCLCTRADLEQVVATSLKPLEVYLHRMELMMQRFDSKSLEVDVNQLDLDFNEQLMAPERQSLDRNGAEPSQMFQPQGWLAEETPHKAGYVDDIIVGLVNDYNECHMELDGDQTNGIVKSADSQDQDGHPTDGIVQPADSQDQDGHHTEGAVEPTHLSLPDDGLRHSLSHDSLQHCQSKMSKLLQFEAEDVEGRSCVQELMRALIIRIEMSTSLTRKRRYASALLPIVRLLQRWDRLKEPVRTGRLADVVTSSVFETCCVAVIFCHSLFVTYSTDLEMRTLTMKTPDNIQSIEYAFAAYYFVELCLRITVHRLYFFVNQDMRWNIFDFILVLITIGDIIVVQYLEADGGDNLTFMRILRLCKMARMLRTFRALRFFKDLAVMLESFRTSFTALFWSFIMLGSVLYVCALIFLQAMTAVMVDDKITYALDDNIRTLVNKYFGSMPKTMLSLYMSVTSGNDWAVYYYVIEHAGPVYAILFVFFTFFFTFALFNILTGIFVEKAVLAATPDRDDLVLGQRRKARQDAAEFRHVCDVLNQGKKDTISWVDFEHQMHNEVMVAYMGSIGLEVHDVELFFQIVAGAANNGEVSIDRFVEGCMQMRGNATGIDMQRQLFETHLLQDLMQISQKEMAVLHTSISNCGKCILNFEMFIRTLDKDIRNCETCIGDFERHLLEKSNHSGSPLELRAPATPASKSSL